MNEVYRPWLEMSLAMTRYYELKVANAAKSRPHTDKAMVMNNATYFEKLNRYVRHKA